MNDSTRRDDVAWLRAEDFTNPLCAAVWRHLESGNPPHRQPLAPGPAGGGETPALGLANRGWRPPPAAARGIPQTGLSPLNRLDLVMRTRGGGVHAAEPEDLYYRQNTVSEHTEDVP